MPQIDWTPEFKRNTTLEFDRLKLKVGEKARIVTLEKPTFTWIHTLRAPKIVDGRANKVIKKRKDGSDFADWDMDFIGRPQCLGDHGVIADNGSDPVNCPVCARAKDSEECSPPERRFAMNVIRYNTKADGTVVLPFGCASVVWTFTEGMFNKLYDIAQEQGGLVGKDLILGPCQVPEAFQKFDLQAGAKHVWESDDRIRQIVEETHKNNRIEDLEAAAGRRVELRWLKEDVKKVAERWRIARGETAADTMTAQADVTNLKGELDNLLAGGAALPPTSSVTSTVGDVPAAYEAPEPAAVVADEPVVAEPTGGSAPDDFSSLLAKLNL